jgi:hypothetical protein
MQTGSKKATARSEKAQNSVTEKSQIDRFKEAARKLEGDESEAAFDEKLKAIVKEKPKDPISSATQQAQKDIKNK